MFLGKNIQAVVEKLSRLPSVGPRAAERIVLYLLKRPAGEIEELAQALEKLKENGFCERCFNLASGRWCSICEDKGRDRKTICVVEDPLDLMAVENQQVFGGIYHVLGGTVRVGQRDNTDKLKIKELKGRVKKEKIKEIIIATNPTTAGDMTAVAVKEALGEFKNLKITRIGRGMPTGGDIEYADGESILGSFKGRAEF